MKEKNKNNTKLKKYYIEFSVVSHMNCEAIVKANSKEEAIETVLAGDLNHKDYDIIEREDRVEDILYSEEWNK